VAKLLNIMLLPNTIGAAVRAKTGPSGDASAGEYDDPRVLSWTDAWRHWDTWILKPNVRAKLPAEAGGVRLVRDDAPCAADQPYAACRSGSA